MRKHDRQVGSFLPPVPHILSIPLLFHILILLFSFSFSFSFSFLGFFALVVCLDDGLLLLRAGVPQLLDVLRASENLKRSP